VIAGIAAPPGAALELAEAAAGQLKDALADKTRRTAQVRVTARRDRSTPMPERRRVTALRYEGGGSPKVVASGRGQLAERILAAAHDAGVPVREDPNLAEALGGPVLGQDVPEELWPAVAEVLAWAYGLEKAAITPNR
jgi:flagellar biosynthesis protein